MFLLLPISLKSICKRRKEKKTLRGSPDSTTYYLCDFEQAFPKGLGPSLLIQKLGLRIRSSPSALTALSWNFELERGAGCP